MPTFDDLTDDDLEAEKQRLDREVGELRGRMLSIQHEQDRRGADRAATIARLTAESGQTTHRPQPIDPAAVPTEERVTFDA